MAKKHDIFLLGICILFAGIIVWGAIDKGANAVRISDLKTTVEKFKADNIELGKRTADAIATADRLTNRLGDAQATIERYRKLIEGAGSGLADLDATIERIGKIIPKIAN